MKSLFLATFLGVCAPALAGVGRGISIDFDGDSTADAPTPAVEGTIQTQPGYQSFADGQCSGVLGSGSKETGTDNCASGPEPISGYGTFDFDNTAATTDGPDHVLCDFFNQSGISKDVWYCWTATATESVIAETCSSATIDTKIAVYSGCTCPLSDAMPPMVCDDDSCDRQSSVTFSAVLGQSYLIRLGNYPTTLNGEKGSFRVRPASSCSTGLAETYEAVQTYKNAFGDNLDLILKVSYTAGQGRHFDRVAETGVAMTGPQKPLDDMLRDYYGLSGGSPASPQVMTITLTLPEAGTYYLKTYHHRADDGTAATATVSINGSGGLIGTQSTGTSPATVTIGIFPFSLDAPGDVVLTFTQTTDTHFGINGLKIARVASGSTGPDGDMDGDGLKNKWENQGLDIDGDGTIDVDLPAMGADPLHKDIFLEIDYMKSDHNHQLQQTAEEIVIQSFHNSPLTNPDGRDGITLHIDSDKKRIMTAYLDDNGKLNRSRSSIWGGQYSKATVLAHVDRLGSISTTNTYNWTAFDNLKNLNFDSDRKAAFHYCIVAHELGIKNLSGISRGVHASDLIVACLSCGSTGQEAGTLMHELGHNLGLRHHGTTRSRGNYAPNYLSIMNYFFQFPGLRKNGKDGHYDYSRFSLNCLDEGFLNESAGVTGAGMESADYGTRYYANNAIDSLISDTLTGIDWNNSNAIDTGTVEEDIDGTSRCKGFGACDRLGAVCRPTNSCSELPCPPGDGPCLTITFLSSTSDNWDFIDFKGGLIGGPLNRSFILDDLPIETDADELDIDEGKEVPMEFRVEVSGNMVVRLTDGDAAFCQFEIFNTGLLNDTYDLEIVEAPDYADTSEVPSQVVVDAGQSTMVEIFVSPLGVPVHDEDRIILSVTSTSNPLIMSVPETNLVIVPEIPFDFDGNSVVDLDDYQLLMDCLAGPGATPNPTSPVTAAQCRNVFDDDIDSDVDLSDFGQFTKAF